MKTHDIVPISQMPCYCRTVNSLKKKKVLYAMTFGDISTAKTAKDFIHLPLCGTP
jgi:hypothetical protein